MYVTIKLIIFSRIIYRNQYYAYKTQKNYSHSYTQLQQRSYKIMYMNISEKNNSKTPN